MRTPSPYGEDKLFRGTIDTSSGTSMKKDPDRKGMCGIAGLRNLKQDKGMVEDGRWSRVRP